jgi:hypothetical protein
VRSQIEGIEWLSISADIGNDVQGLIRAETRDDEAAQQLRTVLAGVLVAARMFAEQDARVAGALNAIQTTGTGRNVELSCVVPSGLLDVFRPGAPLPGDLPDPAP